jgi:hypothetical protein
MQHHFLKIQAGVKILSHYRKCSEYENARQ